MSVAHEALDRLLTKLLPCGHKVLVFSQFTTMLDILEDLLHWRGIRSVRLDGQVAHLQRQERLKQFARTEGRGRGEGGGRREEGGEEEEEEDDKAGGKGNIQAESRCPSGILHSKSPPAQGNTHAFNII